MRRRLAVGLLLTVLLGACGTPEEEVTSGSTTTAAPGAGWEQLPPAPLSPRGGAVLTTLEDGRLLVVGGDMVAGCIDHRAGDRVIAVHGSEERGAASDQLYDPAADSWTELPRDPPVTLIRPLDGLDRPRGGATRP